MKVKLPKDSPPAQKETPPEPLADVMAVVPEPKVRVLDKGFVKLLDVMPRLVPASKGTADFRVAAAARVSFDVFEPQDRDEHLIRYLVRSTHSVPLEHVKFSFHVKCPIFVARQWDKHRTQSKSEASGRYIEFKEEFYEVQPDQVRRQSKNNKQGSDGLVEGEAAAEFAERTRMGPHLAHGYYTAHVADEVAKELARTQLPLSLYTQFVTTVDLHNLLHFLALRADSHAQWEIRQYAEAVLGLIRPVVPMTAQAWEDYHHLRGGLLLSRMEVEHLRTLLAGVSPGVVPGLKDREQAEWLAKAARMGLSGGAE